MKQLVEDPLGSWDGCLLPIDRLYSYGRERYLYGGRAAQFQEGEALFIFDFADSAAFGLWGVDTWEEHLLDKHLVVCGILVQYLDGGSEIIDWEILEVTATTGNTSAMGPCPGE